MALQKPSYAFTIPSIQDGTLLDCRLYIPTLNWRKYSTTAARSAAIVAHPYAPLGGSQDDPVVAAIAATLLKNGCLVGTFNFRGAGGSAGRTSWSAKLELADYLSFYGFVLSYLDNINQSNSLSEESNSTNTDGGRLILAGYSYGSLIARNLPPLSMVTEIFASPSSGSAQAEIILRARDLSTEYSNNQQPAERPVRGHNSLRESGSLVVGGYESEATSKRMSRELSRRSLESGVRRSVDRITKRPSRSASARHASSNDSTSQNPHTFVNTPTICYLLVSPLLAPITAFLSLSSKVKLSTSVAKGNEDVTQDELLLHPSCCIFGQHDLFTSHKRLRRWSKKLEQDSEAKFSTFEVEPAGHFWQEEGAESGLKNAIEQWLGDL